MQGVHELKMNYQIGEHQTVLGAGSFGKVFLSQSVHNKNLKVAIKAMDKIKLKMDVELVNEEVAILNKLDHPNIVNYFETYNDYRYVYLVMEYVPGKVLNKYLMEQKSHSEKKICHVMQQVISAIAHCHAIGIIHRDIKAENIMMSNEGQIKLLDFGLSKNSRKVDEKEICGTPYYMAPEMIVGDKYTAQIDVWSLGVLIYYLVSGHLPFNQRTQKELFAQICFGKVEFDYKEFAMVSDEC